MRRWRPALTVTPEVHASESVSTALASSKEVSFGLLSMALLRSLGWGKSAEGRSCATLTRSECGTMHLTYIRWLWDGSQRRYRLFGHGACAWTALQTGLRNHSSPLRADSHLSYGCSTCPLCQPHALKDAGHIRRQSISRSKANYDTYRTPSIHLQTHPRPIDATDSASWSETA